ncbi:hypothetical protein QFZ33_000466 [Arthrobacter globiformis]|nr:hypothetical protein [Arthrobacter globiformis]
MWCCVASSYTPSGVIHARCNTKVPSGRSGWSGRGPVVAGPATFISAPLSGHPGKRPRGIAGPGPRSVPRKWRRNALPVDCDRPSTGSRGMQPTDFLTRHGGVARLAHLRRAGFTRGQVGQALNSGVMLNDIRRNSVGAASGYRVLALPLRGWAAPAGGDAGADPADPRHAPADALLIRPRRTFLRLFKRLAFKRLTPPSSPWFQGSTAARPAKAGAKMRGWLARQALLVDVRGEGAHEVQIAVLFGVVQAVAHHELVGDVVADVLDVDLHLGGGGLAEGRADFHRRGAA